LNKIVGAKKKTTTKISNIAGLCDIAKIKENQKPYPD
jgi:hypothetical protein